MTEALRNAVSGGFEPIPTDAEQCTNVRSWGKPKHNTIKGGLTQAKTRAYAVFNSMGEKGLLDDISIGR